MDSKKAQAAIAGVVYYLQSQEENESAYGSSSVSPDAPVSSWALYGRQTIMQMRTLVQRRVLKR